MRKFKTAVAVALVAMAGLPVAASAGGNRASTVLHIQGHVPVICRVQVSTILSSPDSNGIADLGVAEEFCNAPRGYRVVVMHPANLEGAALISSGVRIPLDQSGETVMTDSDRPNLRRAPLAVDLGGHPERFSSLNFRIEAKS